MQTNRVAGGRRGGRRAWALTLALMLPALVWLGRLGASAAGRAGLLASAPFQSVAAAADASCAFFAATGQRVCFGFKSYWESHGLEFGDPDVSYRESLALFGYPISEEFRQNGMTVQYFERAVFEYHPNNPQPYKVLLRHLGSDALSSH